MEKVVENEEEKEMRKKKGKYKIENEKRGGEHLQ